MILVTNTKLADRCKDLLTLCGNTVFRKRLTHLELVLRRKPTVQNPDHVNRRLSVYLSFKIWNDFEAYARLLTNQPTGDIYDMYNILRTTKTPTAVAMYTFKRDMESYSKRYDEFLSDFHWKTEIEMRERKLMNDELV